MTELESVKVSSTVIVVSKDRKILIIQRPPNESFPNKWTVAGGKLQNSDGELRSEGFLYYSAEACARRELFEETGVHIWNTPLYYLCSITTIWGETKRVILSFYVILDRNADEIKLTLSECQAYAWITFDDIKNYDFIPDIGEEIKEVLMRITKE